jgi:hypothetical protein
MVGNGFLMDRPLNPEGADSACATSPGFDYQNRFAICCTAIKQVHRRRHKPFGHHGRRC